MPLINFTKEELQKIEYYLLGETDPIVMDILEKIGNLDDLFYDHEFCSIAEEKDDIFYDINNTGGKY